jgi:hypothetical protein
MKEKIMALSNSINTTPTTPAHKGLWEDPSLVVERALVARAQDGGGDSEETWALQRLLGPLATSFGGGDVCL